MVLKICFMYVIVLPTYVSMYHLYNCCPWRPEEGMSDFLKLELQTAVSHHMGAGNQVFDVWKSSPCS